MLFDTRMDVFTAKMLVTCSTDVAALPEVKGTRFVVRSLNVGSFDKEASVPIEDGYVSGKDLEEALRKIGAFLA